jgi:phosphoribosylformimino-5-aminoimidazole carboxamide ribotide isomerase
MQVIPAIDILNTQLVRLIKGDPTDEIKYRIKDPAEAAQKWAELGAEMIHVIDLDAALDNKPNTDSILDIAVTVDVQLQVGGGIRSVEYARMLLDGGVERIILGSMPINSPEEALRLLNEYGADRVVVALDHKDGLIMVKGWQEFTGLSLSKSLSDLSGVGYERFLVTNINQDGMLTGPDTETYSTIAGRAKIIASGGISSTQDVARLRETGVEAAVIGRALYENRFTLDEAMEAAGC